MGDEQKVFNIKVLIIGAGPAGLTAVYDLCRNTNIKPIILEATADIGGLSKTVNYKGNRIDIGGHRFFSKSQAVMRWWMNILPLDAGADPIFNSQSTKGEWKADPDKTDKVMLVRSRLSRIYYLNSFFDYPVSFSLNTLVNLGVWRLQKIMASYLHAEIFPARNERSLEDFLINRFGRELSYVF